MSDPPSPADRIGLIEGTKHPLGFLVLSMLVVEALLGGFAWGFPEQRTLLIWAIITLVVMLILIVCGFAIWNPGIVDRERPWSTHLATQMADDLYLALAGALGNLPQEEQAEAWKTVVDVITSHNEDPRAYNQFCAKLGERLLQRTKIQISATPRGIIKAEQAATPDT